MIDPTLWQASRQQVMGLSHVNAMQSKMNIVLIRESNAKRVRKGLIAMLVTGLVTVAVLVSFMDAASANTNAIHNVAGLTPESPAAGLNYYSDYLFVLALPFAVALLMNVSVTLRQILSRLR